MISEADAFVLFYIQRRIEAVGLLWHEAPYWGQSAAESAAESDAECDEVPEGWALMERAADRFEQDNRDELEGLIDRLAEGVDGKSAIHFRAFKHIVDAYFDLLQTRLQKKSDCTANAGALAGTCSSLCVPLLALIAFTGMFARRLAQMDVEVQSYDPCSRDFRREIYQVSIYGSAMLRSKLDKFAAAEAGGYSWTHFGDDITKLMEHIEANKEPSLDTVPRGTGRYGVGMLCGLAVAAAACILIARRSVGAH